MARHLEAHADDADEWEQEGRKPVRPRETSIVFSVRFRADELARIKQVADREGVRVSDLVRDAVLQYTFGGRRPRITLALPSSGKVVLTNVELAVPTTEAPRLRKEPSELIPTTVS
jgi:hypothetical protein